LSKLLITTEEQRNLGKLFNFWTLGVPVRKIGFNISSSRSIHIKGAIVFISKTIAPFCFVESSIYIFDQNN
jgi:hypothetical protein